MNIPYEEILTYLERIESLLLKQNATKPEPVFPISDKFLTIDQAAKMINMTTGSVYQLVHQRKVPFAKRGKRLYFSEKDLRSWIESGRRQTVQEIEADALKSLSGQ
jgi:excisionase family DNA binding protein